MKTTTDPHGIAPDSLEREARAWLRRLTSGGATQADAQAFRRWRATSPSHEAAFADAQRWWKALDPALTQVVSRNDKLKPSVDASARRPVWGRRAFLGGAAGFAAAAAAAGVTVFGPDDLRLRLDDWQADYRTAAGQQQQVALNAHVSVQMNTRTSIARRNVDGRTVGMELISGEAAIDISGSARSFVVTAGAGRSIADGGRFEVRYTGDSVCVSCVEGTLRVEHPSGARVLTSREQVVYTRHSLGDVVTADMAALSAWRNGVLVFRQTPLARVIDEINRYRPGRVILLDSSVSQREVSGRFSIRTLDTVLVQIQTMYKLQARRLPGGVLLLS